MSENTKYWIGTKFPNKIFFNFLKKEPWAYLFENNFFKS